MCGIFGILSYREPVEQGQVKSLTRMLAHRGPDDEGFFFSRPGDRPSIGMGHRRLSIIDLSANGHQPMCNEDGTLWIVFNGEIYDFHRQRRALMDKGHVFKSDTDTETILHLYEEHGPRCLDFLRGMFAFAIWDQKNKRFFAARDRLGKKPFYYAATANGLYFSSEINPLYRIDEIDQDLDLQALDLYMSYSYIPSPYTALKGIRKLPAAHYLMVDANRLEIERYWDLNFVPKIDVSFHEGQQMLREKIREATRIRLFSDVPLGCFLSGGVDSSLVLASMSELTSQPVKTFSIGFPQKAFDETPYARQAAGHFHSEHREFMVEPASVGILSKLVKHYGEPYGDASALPTWYLSELTRKYVTVVLNGDGGDELFAGYNWYATSMALHGLGKFFPNRLALALVQRLSNDGGKPSLRRKAGRLMDLLAKDDASRFADLRAQLSNTYKAMLYSPGFMQRLESISEDYVKRLYEEHRFEDELDRMLYVDTMTYLPEELLVKVDRATMAHALEGRSPLLDHELVELAAGLPSHFKYKRGRKKHIIRTMAREIMPPGFFNRPKSGFSVPLQTWFSSDLEPYARERLMAGPLKETGLFNLNAVEHIISENKSGWRNHGDLIWRLLMLSEWLHQFRS